MLSFELPPHRAGRQFGSERVVRLSDVSPDGWVRLDAVARYLQDVATDDVRDAGVERAVAWMVRRTSIAVSKRPRYGEKLSLSTWCSGIGSSLAERRTTIEGQRGAEVEAVSLWVALDSRSLRPAPLTGPHFDAYRPSAGDRRVRSRFVVPAPADGETAGARPWPLRHSDFDLYGHVNNVVAWAAVEEECRRLAPDEPVMWAQVEYRTAIEPGDRVEVGGRRAGDLLSLWMIGAGRAPAVCAGVGLGRRAL